MYFYLPECGQNEEIRCVYPCPPEKTCKNRGIHFSCLQNVQACQHKCTCKDGFYRNAEGICVTNEQCEPGICTGENEVYTDCKKSCPPETCFSISAFYACDKYEPCQKGCVCQDGYLRKERGSPCIRTCQCPRMIHSPDCMT